MRILAVDYGSKRVGLAISDVQGILASPLQTWRNTDDSSLVAKIAQLVNEFGVDRVLLGIPLLPSGSLSVEASRIVQFGHCLSAALLIPLTWCDEAYTTTEAKNRLLNSNKSRKQLKLAMQNIDALAACVLLETYLAAPLAEVQALPPIAELLEKRCEP